jgi:hypothetical protein
MCKDEPLIAGGFVDRAAWLASAKDERAIFERSTAFTYPPRPLPPMPPPACAPFDVSIAGIAGRAVCFGESGVKGGSILVVAADDYAAFVLGFSRQDGTVDMLRERVLELLPRFKIERATGEAALLKWFRR